MSDVRERLVSIVELTLPAVMHRRTAEAVADAVLMRFDLEPKPPIVPNQLGMLVADSHLDGELSLEEQGNRMLRALRIAGLKIVRVDDER